MISVFVSDTLKVSMWKQDLSVISPRPCLPHQKTHLSLMRPASPLSGWPRDLVTMALWLMLCGHCETWCWRTRWPLPEPFLLRIFSQVIRSLQHLLQEKDTNGAVFLSLFVSSSLCCSFVCLFCGGGDPQWGAADAEIKVPSGENTELKRSPFQAWSRSVYSHTWYAYCQGVLPCLFLPFQGIHLHFFQNLSQFFPVLACRIK